MLEYLKDAVCQANKDLVKHGLVIFTWGNVSAIDPNTKIIAIKPSGVPYESLTPDDIVLVDLEGNILEGKKNPSSDLDTHLELYKSFPDIRSIVHTHSTYATIFAQAKCEVRCFGTTHADTYYGSVPITRDLTEDEIKGDYGINTGKVIVEHFKEHNIDPLQVPACLVARHGPFVWGTSIDKAIYNSVVLERVAKMNIATMKLNTETTPITKILLDKHYLRKHGKNATYGQGGQ